MREKREVDGKAQGHDCGPVRYLVIVNNNVRARTQSAEEVIESQALSRPSQVDRNVTLILVTGNRKCPITDCFLVYLGSETLKRPADPY